MGIIHVILSLMADERPKPVLTPARLAANRRNAQESTGSRTVAGGAAPPALARLGTGSTEGFLRNKARELLKTKDRPQKQTENKAKNRRGLVPPEIERQLGRSLAGGLNLVRKGGRKRSRSKP